MGFLLNLFGKAKHEAALEKLPSGSFTVDKSGKVIASTLPQSVPEEQVIEVGKTILATFLSAQAANLPLREFYINYAGLKITAKEQRGGAMIFLAPRSLS
jgi:hypothetical protein